MKLLPFPKKARKASPPVRPLRPYSLRVCLSGEESDMVKNLARKRHLSVSDYVRQLVRREHSSGAK
jgi:hypothetical protein